MGIYNRPVWHVSTCQNWKEVIYLSPQEKTDVIPRLFTKVDRLFPNELIALGLLPFAVFVLLESTGQPIPPIIQDLTSATLTYSSLGILKKTVSAMFEDPSYSDQVSSPEPITVTKPAKLTLRKF